MKAQELRIGNIVSYQNINFVLTDFLSDGYCEIRSDLCETPIFRVHIESLMPCEISIGSLFGYGFKLDNDGIWCKNKCLFWIGGDTLQIALNYAPLFNCPCKYVHQLQNIIYCLTGEELCLNRG